MADSEADEKRYGMLDETRERMESRISEIEAMLAAQVDFTERLRRGANLAIAHASHINQNYCRDVPQEKLAEWAEAQVVFNALSVTPSPAQAFSTVVRDGAAVN